jgi:hypothetical protein
MDSVVVGYACPMGRAIRDNERFGRNETANIFDLASALDEDSPLDDPDLTRSDLYRIADELGIAPAAIDAAIAEVRRRERSIEKESKKNVRRRLRLLRHTMAFLVVVSVLAIVDALDGGGWWFIYVAAIWAIVLGLYGLRFFTRRNGPLEQRLLSP